MERPRISLVIPNLNNQHYIERTLCAAIDQQYPNLELIVVDGGSVDGSIDLIELYRTELSCFIVEHDGGRNEAINKGLTQASGEIVGIINGDDLLMPGAIDAVVERFAADDKPRWIAGGALRIDNVDREVGRSDAECPASTAGFLMRNSGFIPGSAAFYHADLLDRAGRFDPNLRFAGDYDVHCRLFIRDIQPAIVGNVLAAVRSHHHDLTAAETLQQVMEYIEVAERYARRLPMTERYPLWRNLDQRRRIHALASVEVQHGIARRRLLQELVQHPWWVADEAYRHMLLHGVEHPLDETRPSRSAA